MALIADVANAFKGALGPVRGFQWWSGDRLATDLTNVVSAAGDITGSTLDFVQASGMQSLINAVDALSRLPVGVTTTPNLVMGKLVSNWTDIMTEAFGVLNVDRPDAVFGPQETIEASLRRELAFGSEESIKRVGVAVAAINLVILSGSSASIAAEAASLGIVRSLAEAIQSWVWANGLGAMGSMAFTPQINASLSPWLTRHYERQAQARIPGEGDLVRFQLREVFLEGRRQELLDASDRSIFDELMAQRGYSKFHADNYWAAHWSLPSITQLNEMLHRGVISEETWEQFVRFNDYEPSSIDRLKDIIYSPFTRVDARRMARLGLLSQDELLQAYADQGYFAPTVQDSQGRWRAQFVGNPDFTIHKAQAMVVFTNVFNAVPELRARFRRGHISPQALLEGLEKTGIPTAKAQVLWETIVDADEGERIKPEKDLTRAQITRAWKLTLISYDQALVLIERLGYSRPEADLLLRTVQLPDFPGAFAGTELGAQLTGDFGAVPIPFDPLEGF